MKNQLSDEKPSNQPVRDGEERLATQAERDYVNETIEGLEPSLMKNVGGQAGGRSAFEVHTIEEQPPSPQSQMTIVSSIQRETGDQVNRFLLCALVSESSKSIKASAKKAGESLPMTMIVRGVLRSYLMAAKDNAGPLADAELDIAGIRMLNKKVLKDEIARHSRDRVNNMKRQLAQARRYGDESRIKAVEEGLERAIESHDRLNQ